MNGRKKEQEAWVFTITMANTISYKKKMNKISKLERFFKMFKYASKGFYTIEYHKKKDKISSNYFRPHIHGILYTDKMVEINRKYVVGKLEDFYGRTQFELQEDPEQIETWIEYIQKEVEENDINCMPIKHKIPFEIVKLANYERDQAMERIADEIYIQRLQIALDHDDSLDEEID